MLIRHLNRIRNQYSGLSVAAKAALWFTFCNFILKGIGFISTPLFTRFLPSSEYGSLSVIMSYETIIMILATWEIPLSAYQRGLLKYKDNIRFFTKSSVVLSNLLTTAFFLMVFGIFKWFTNFTGLSLHNTITLYMYLLLYPAFNCWLVYKRTQYEYIKVVGLTIVQTLANVIVPMIAILLISRTAEIKFRYALISSVAIYVFFYIHSMKGASLHKNMLQVREQWKYILTFQAPLIFHSLSHTVLSQADRVMIGKMIGTSEAAYYSVAYTIASVIVIVQSSIIQAFVPWILNKLEMKDFEDIKKTATPLLLLVGIIVAGFVFVGPELISLLFTPEYYEAIWCIPPITVGVFFQFLYSLYVWVENYYECTSYVAIASLICAVTNILLNYFAIGMFGYIACGYTTLISYILFAVLHYLFVLKIRKEKNVVSQIYDLKYILMISFGLLALMLIALFTYKYVLWT